MDTEEWKQRGQAALDNCDSRREPFEMPAFFSSLFLRWKGPAGLRGKKTKRE